jgi:hypothetical protein
LDFLRHSLYVWSALSYDWRDKTEELCEKIVPVSLFTTGPTGTGLGSNRDLHCENTASHYLTVAVARPT